MNSIKRYFKTLRTLIKSTPVILLFELNYKLILLAVIAPVLKFLLSTSLEIADIKYLTSHNIWKFLSHPAIWLFIGIIIIGAIFIILVEFSAIVTCLAVYYKKQRIGVAGMLKAGLHTAVKVFKSPRNITAFAHCFLILLFTQFAATSGIFSYVGLPNLQTLAGVPTEKLFTYVYATGLIVFTLFFSSRIYSLPLFTLTDRKYYQCIKKSKELTKKRRVKISVSFVLWNILLTLVCAAVIFVVGFITILAVKGFSQTLSAITFGFKCAKNILSAIIICSVLFSSPMLVVFISACFFTEKKTVSEIEINLPERTVKPLKTRAFFAVLLAASIAVNYSFLKNASQDKFKVNINFLNRTKITAHRGASNYAPENTVHAFYKAMEIGADYIELDVQQTADGKLVVFHDKNLKRTTGKDALLSQFTYEELQQLDCGSWFSDAYKDSKIMLFSDILEITKGKIKLNVEIKKCDNVTEVAKQTVAMIEEYDCVKSCYITSFSYSALKAVKKANPAIKTGIITNMLTYDSYTKLKYIDAISINKLFTTQNIVNMAHANGKKVFVWTVDDSYEFDKYISMGVDNIITDHADDALEKVSKRGADGYVISILSWIFNS